MESLHEDIIKKERETAKKYYNFDLNESNQNPSPRPNQISQNTDFNPIEWLKGIDGYRKINSLSIAGTHDSGARFHGPLSRCQKLTIQEQLLNGVRYLDIRCRHINNCFMIHHSKHFQFLSFGSGVRDVCIKYLKDHPSEFIYMQIKEEYKSERNTRSFFETMKEYVLGYEDYFFLEEISPTLDQARGKIVLLRRFSTMGTPFGNELDFHSEIFTSNTTIIARIQDAYNVKSLLHREYKWQNIMRLMGEAMENTDDDKLFINFLSGSTRLCFPYSTADYVLPKLHNYLKNINKDSFVGVIMFDYLTEKIDDLIYCLLKRNFN